MAFDVYVGTMTRFYRREWENAAQRMARDQGLTYTMIYAGGEPEPPPAAEDIREAVTGWCRGLSASFAAHDCGPVAWDENDNQPYFTDRPGWDGYSAMLIWAAHAEHSDLPIPRAVPESWLDDPAVQRSKVPGFKSRYLAILQPQLWLPIELPFVFDSPTIVCEENSRIGSTFMLKQQLDELYSQTALKLCPVTTTIPTELQKEAKPGLIGRLFGRKPVTPEPPKPQLAELAQFGLQIFRDLATKACEHRLPILLHF